MEDNVEESGWCTKSRSTALPVQCTEDVHGRIVQSDRKCKSNIITCTSKLDIADGDGRLLTIT